MFTLKDVDKKCLAHRTRELGDKKGGGLRWFGHIECRKMLI